MRIYNRKSFSVIFALLLVFFNGFSEDYTHFVLDNGLEVFAVEDMTNPLSHITLSVKAGSSNQNQKTTGFFELYTRVFWSTNSQFKSEAETMLAYEKLGATDFLSECNADDARYSFSFPAESLQKVMEIFSSHLISPHFPDNTLKTQFTALKNEALDFQKSPAGFINSTIETIIHSDNPWQHDPGVYAALTSYKQIPKVRAKLTEISQNYYTANNLAIFISGPFTSEEIISYVHAFFSTWQSKPLPPQRPKDKKEIENRKFALISSDFSRDITQVIIEYPSAKNNNLDSAISGQIAALILDNPRYTLKTNISFKPEIGIKEPDYLNVSYSDKGRFSRLVIQALMEKTKISPAEQTDKLIDTLLESSVITPEQFTYSKNFLYNQKAKDISNISSYLNLLANNWIYQNSNQVSSFNDTLQTITEENLSTTFLNDPFVFLLLHPDNYNKQKSIFEKNKYKIIKPDTKNLLFDLSTDNADESESTIVKQKPELVQRIVSESTKKLTTFELSNKIPVVLYDNNKSSTTTLRLDISGGEYSNNTNQRGLETIVINALADNIEQYIYEQTFVSKTLSPANIFSNTGIKSSSISMECLSSDFLESLSCFSNALIYGDITHSHADELMNQEKYRWHLNNNDLDFQLLLTGLSTLYSGTSIQKLFDIRNEILTNVNYNNIRSAYASLLNASRFRIIISGDISSIPDIKEELEKKFGVLQAFQTEKNTFEQPVFSAMTLKTKLKRIFTSDVPAEKAGKRPLHLIPTKDFYDPAHVLITAPTGKTTDNILFKAILGYVEQNLNKNKNNVKVEFSKENLPIVSINFTKVQNVETVKKAFQEQIKNLPKEITSENLQTIKNLCISEHLKNTQTNIGLTELISNGLENTNTPDNWLTEYLFLQNATLSDFQQVIEKYLANPVILWIFSADTPEKEVKKR